MFIGEYRHCVDTKGRLTLPSKFRESLGTTVVVNRGFEGCLNVYTMDEWKNVFERLMSMPTNKKEARTFVRLFTSKAQEIDLDKLGRINLPKSLMEIGSIQKDCVVVGVGNHIEIWDQQLWDNYYNNEQQQFENISELLDDFGI